MRKSFKAIGILFIFIIGSLSFFYIWKSYSQGGGIWVVDDQSNLTQKQTSNVIHDSLERKDLQKHKFDGVFMEEELDHLVSTLSLEEKVGQMFMPAIRNWNGQNVTNISSEIEEVVSKFHLGGIILFKENVEDPVQTLKLIQDLQAATSLPLFISIDQEGGLVNRIPWMPTMPGNMALGATRDPLLAKRVGLTIGQQINAVGVNMNMAPSFDVNNNADNPVIGIRSFGEDPELVAKLGLAFAEGLQEAGVIAVGKHFPGHGDTSTDSHLVLPTVSHPIERLQKVELYPFERAIQQGIPGIMTAHITYPSLDSTEVKSIKDDIEIWVPATLSKKILTDLVRKEMGFEGLLITDAMEMKAISTHFGTVEAVVKAIEAGNDIILIPNNLEKAYQGVLSAVKDGVISEERIDESVKRIIQTKWEAGILQQTGEGVSGQKGEGASEILDPVQVEREVAQASVTLVKDGGQLPLRSEPNQKILILADSTVLTRLEKEIQGKTEAVSAVQISKGANENGKFTSDQVVAIKNADLIIVATRTSFGNSKENYQNHLVNELLNYDKPTIALILGSPYDFGVYPNVHTAVATFSSSSASIEAAVQFLFGKIEANGRLPVTIPALSVN